MIQRLVRISFVAGFLATVFAAVATVRAQIPAAAVPRVSSPGATRPGYRAPVPIGRNGEEMVDSFKLQDGDIDAVLSALETYTGKTIVRPGQLPTAPYSIKITRPIPKSDLIIALETLLTLNQIAVTPLGDRFLKVTALAQAKSETPEMLAGSTFSVPPSGRIATHLFELNFLRVNEFVPQLQTMLTPGIGGGVVQLEKANAVLVTDTVENLQRIERLLAQVDGPRDNSLTTKFYVLHADKPSDLVTKIHAMLSGPAQNQLRATTTFSADDRTNQLIVIADPRELPFFDALVSHLDVRSDPNMDNEVIRLKHADAKDMNTLLAGIIAGQNSAIQKAAGQSVRPGQSAAPAPGSPAAMLAAAADGLTPSGEFSNLVTIQPDERTNSIVVSGTRDDVRIVRDLIDKIDVLLSQVSIEVVIAEVTLTDTDDSGINALSATISKATNGGTSITNVTGSVAGVTVGSANSVANAAGVIAGDINPISLLASIQALGDYHKVKILEQNTIVTTHNHQAQIVVSQQQPIITGVTSTPTAATTTTSGLTTSSSVTYKDIGITLKVTPLIGDDGSIALTIDQTVDDNQGSVTIDGNAQPIIGHREATSVVNIMDGQLVVLGGLQNSSKTYDRSKLGFLFEIPILSNILGARTLERDRTELLLFIKPHILHVDDSNAYTKKQIHGMSNHAHIEDYLKDTTRMPDDHDTLKQQFK
jgi:general secretion pathway protein D